MISEVEILLGEYRKWLRSKTTLRVKASKDDFALRKHTLLQAMLAVNDLFYLASPVVASIFYEDVAIWLDRREIRYAPRVKFTGKSGYDHMFDFIIPKSGKEPERILRTVNRPGRDTDQAAAFSWIDTKDVRPPGSRAYAILNDSENPVPDGVYNAFLNYGVRPVPWSDRDRMAEELAA